MVLQERTRVDASVGDGELEVTVEYSLRPAQGGPKLSNEPLFPFGLFSIFDLTFIFLFFVYYIKIIIKINFYTK